MSRAYAHDFNTEMKGNFVIPQTLASVLEENTSLTRPEVLTILHKLLRENPRIVGIDVGYEPDAFDGKDKEYANTPGHDASGRFMPYWNRLSGTESLDPMVDMDTSDWYTIPKQTGKNEVIEPLIYGGVLMTSYISPIQKNGTFLGIVGMDVTLGNLDTYVSRIHVYRTGYAFLVSNRGTFVACPDKLLIGNRTLAWLGEEKHNEDLKRIAGDVREGREGYVETVDPFTGRNVVMFYTPIQTGNWSMIIVAPTDEMLAGVMDRGRMMILIGIFSILLVGGIVVLVARTITEPIVVLTRSADQMATGDLDVHVPDQDGELGILARAFNNMAGRLRETITRLESKVSELETTQQALKESEEKYRSILYNIQDVFYRSDRDGNLIMASPSWAQMLGYESVEDCLGRNIANDFYQHPQDRRRFRQMVENEGSVRDYEVELKKKDGASIFVSTNSHLYYDKNGAVAGIEGIFRDITERRLAQEALSRKNEELNIAYEQLAATEEELRKNFDELNQSQRALEQARKKLSLLNAVTFEDIQNAIFSLSGFINLQIANAQEPSQEKIPRRQEEIVKKIGTSLEFARNYQDMGINPPRWQNVCQVFLFAVSHLDFSGMERKIALDDVEIYADNLLEKVFFNLAENTKQHGGTATRVSLSHSETPEGLLLIYEDNGAGVDAALKEKIFSRGYGVKKGMGLYLAREILGITGIQIKENGVPGQGARFEILIPPQKYRFPHKDSG
ncbi:MAG: PAS domain S-box protein [Methanomicrobiales archaeon]|nr:PAS domain S-box protein [Methanomicrobiales archaeon]